MKLQDVVAGTRAIKRVRMPLINCPGELQVDQPELKEQRKADQGETTAGQPYVEVGLRAMTGEEYADVLSRAHSFSLSRGIEKPDETSPIYNLGVAVYTCAVACVDPDSDPRKPQRFFGTGTVESAADELLKSPHVGRDVITYLHEQQEAWQDQVNPQALKLDLVQMWKLVGEVADSAGPLLNMRPGMRAIFTTFTARLAVNSPEYRSYFGLLSPDIEESSTSGSVQDGEPEPPEAA